MKELINRISIPAILEVGNGKMKGVGRYLNKVGISKVVIFFGEGIYDIIGEDLINSINGIKENRILKTYDFYDTNIQSIAQMAFTIPGNTECIIGIGGGKVLDCAKYIAFLNNLPFISIPTSTSHDGFASSNCSLEINGKRTSVHARMPYGVVVDLGVVKSAPEKFVYSGIGDIISKITAVYDWLFEEKNGYETVHDFAVMMAKKSVNSIARMEFESIKDNFFLKELVDSLTMSGIAMEIAGKSSPASGSEHLISHALDKILDVPELHGIQVGISTYIMSMVQNHRCQRVGKFLGDTGFFDFVKTTNLKKSDFERAINMAPEIKPNRHTVVHIDENRQKAIRLLYEDEILADILK